VKDFAASLAIVTLQPIQSMDFEAAQLFNMEFYGFLDKNNG
jgi:hypothetical protein